MKNLIASLLISSLLVGCTTIPSFLNPFSSKGGPSVNANVLAGKENTQQLVGQQNQQDAGRDINTTTVKKEVEAEKIEEIKISNTNIPIWVILLLLLGWLLPTPTDIFRGIGNIFSTIFQRKK